LKDLIKHKQLYVMKSRISSLWGLM